MLPKHRVPASVWLPKLRRYVTETSPKLHTPLVYFIEHRPIHKFRAKTRYDRTVCTPNIAALRLVVWKKSSYNNSCFDPRSRAGSGNHTLTGTVGDQCNRNMNSAPFKNMCIYNENIFIYAHNKKHIHISRILILFISSVIFHIYIYIYIYNFVLMRHAKMLMCPSSKVYADLQRISSCRWLSASANALELQQYCTNPWIVCGFSVITHSSEMGWNQPNRTTQSAPLRAN